MFQSSFVAIEATASLDSFHTLHCSRYTFAKRVFITQFQRHPGFMALYTAKDVPGRNNWLKDPNCDEVGKNEISFRYLFFFIQFVIIHYSFAFFLIVICSAKSNTDVFDQAIRFKHQPVIHPIDPPSLKDRSGTVFNVLSNILASISPQILASKEIGFHGQPIGLVVAGLFVYLCAF